MLELVNQQSEEQAKAEAEPELQYAAHERNQRPFYSLNGFVTRSISLLINFFRT
jgi:hypothetical protein